MIENGIKKATCGPFEYKQKVFPDGMANNISFETDIGIKIGLSREEALRLFGINQLNN